MSREQTKVPRPHHHNSRAVLPHLRAALAGRRAVEL